MVNPFQQGVSLTCHRIVWSLMRSLAKLPTEGESAVPALVWASGAKR
jgi:hypothetical protein